MNVEFDVVLQEGDNGNWIVSVPSLPGCFSQGRTKEEALEHVREAIALSLEATEPRPTQIAHVTV